MDPFTNCARKEAFPSKEAAAKRIRAWYASDDFKVEGHPRPYKCAICRKHHIGRANGRRGEQGRTRR
jgi:hypothetical protein